MLISIIIPSFRQPHFLGRAIESCLEQDYRDLEVIVVEDRSRDASLGIAVSYAQSDERVRVIECGENGGLGKARNVGIAHATGEYLCFLDSDDYLLDRSISARVDALENAQAAHGDGLVGVYGDWQHVTESVDYPVVRKARSSMPVVSAQTYTGENVFICSAPLVRREAVLAAGGFPEGLRMLEDFSLWAKMIASGAIFAPVHHVVATYRQRPNSMLRGDGVVVMADHVRVINDWMATHYVPVADGGALTSWLADEPPFSHGRMSWNVPSVLGNFGGAPGAESLRSGVGQLEVSSPQVADFMSEPATTGLENPWPLWTARLVEAPDVAIVVSSLEHSVQALGIVAEAGLKPSAVMMFAADPTNWSTLWPLALSGLGVRSTSELVALTEHTTTVDLSTPDHPFVNNTRLTSAGIESLWPDQPARSASLVYVPTALAGYPALDAWISVALHALADADLDPRLVCDPEMHDLLGGYRSEFFSVEALRSTSIVVAPKGLHLTLTEQLAPTVIFDPSVEGAHPRTASQLRASIAAEL